MKTAKHQRLILVNKHGSQACKEFCLEADSSVGVLPAGYSKRSLAQVTLHVDIRFMLFLCLHEFPPISSQLPQASQ